MTRNQTCLYVIVVNNGHGELMRYYDTFLVKACSERLALQKLIKKATTEEAECARTAVMGLILGHGRSLPFYEECFKKNDKDSGGVWEISFINEHVDAILGFLSQICEDYLLIHREDVIGEDSE